jgi:hypothetical protein
MKKRETRANVTFYRSMIVLAVAIFLNGLAQPMIPVRGDYTQTDNSIYLPQVMNQYPLQTIFGVSMDSLSTSGGFSQIANAQATWTRREFPWNAVEPVEGERNWAAVSTFDDELINARSQNMKVILVIHYTPAWAQPPLQSTSCPGKVAANKFNALANFISDLVKRYSVSPYNIQYWELWNEPDVNGFLGCWGDPADAYYGGGYYGQMLKTVYPRFKQADPNAQVLVGGLLLDCDPRTPQTACSGKDEFKATSAKFLEGILLNGGGSFFDGISFHAYDYYDAQNIGQYYNTNWWSSSSTTGPSALVKAAYIRALLAKYNVPNKFLMNTEVALLVCGNNEVEANCLNDGGNRELTKSSFLVQSMVTAYADGLKANLWYSALGTRGTGLLNPDLTTRSSYDAFAFARAEIADGKNISIKSYGGIQIYEVTNSTKKVWVVWSKDGTVKPLTLDTLPRSAFDMLGKPLTPSITIHVDWQPVYLEFYS